MGGKRATSGPRAKAINSRVYLQLSEPQARILAEALESYSPLILPGTVAAHDAYMVGEILDKALAAPVRVAIFTGKQRRVDA